MAYFAKLNENNVVVDVMVISDCAVGSCIGKDHWDYQEEYHKDHGNLQFPDTEPLGQAVIAQMGFEGTWLQTSGGNNFRGPRAVEGYLWDGTNFVPPASIQVE